MQTATKIKLHYALSGTIEFDAPTSTITKSKSNQMMWENPLFLALESAWFNNEITDELLIAHVLKNAKGAIDKSALIIQSIESDGVYHYEERI